MRLWIHGRANVMWAMAEEDNKQILRPCRIEHKHEDYEWETIWPRIRLPGLGTELASFIFKVLHDILPTQERVAWN